MNGHENSQIGNLIEAFILWRLLFNAKSAVGRLRDLELAAHGVTPEQAQVLLTLSSKNGKSTISEMSDAWLRQRNSVSTLVERMSKQGLVKKIKYPGIRELEIQITPKGEEMHNRVSISRETFDNVFGILSDEDRKRLAGYLESIVLQSRGLLGVTSNLPFQV